MVFNEIDKKTMKMLSTLVMLSRDTNAKEEDIIKVGQHLGVPKDQTMELIEEVDEFDSVSLSTTAEKEQFLNVVFEYMHEDFKPSKSELKFYNNLASYLGVDSTSN